MPGDRVNAVLQMTPNVSIEGYKGKWKVVKDEEWLTLEDGRVFLMLSVQNYSLSGLLCKGGKRAPGGQALCLSQSIGFHELTKKRNDESRLLWAQEQGSASEVSALFDVVAPARMVT